MIPDRLRRRMGDTKRGREKQAADEDRRQRERDLAESLARSDESEPPDEAIEDALGDLSGALDGHDYPATAAELREAYGEREVGTIDGRVPLRTVFDGVDDETYASADEVRARLLRLARG
jgi:hypothetical protein